MIELGPSPPPALGNLHRLLTGPLVAAMTVIACALAAALQLGSLPPGPAWWLLLAATAGGSAAGALAGGRPLAANALPVGVAAAVTAALLLRRLDGTASVDVTLRFLAAALPAGVALAFVAGWLRQRLVS